MTQQLVDVYAGYSNTRWRQLVADISQKYVVEMLLLICNSSKIVKEIVMQINWCKKNKKVLMYRLNLLDTLFGLTGLNTAEAMVMKKTVKIILIVRDIDIQEEELLCYLLF